MAIEPTTKLTGGRVNYYLSIVEYPDRIGQEPYVAECNDLIESLALTPDEANIFKEIWRSANARLGNGKPDHTALYGAEKIVYSADRILKRHQRAAVNVNAEKIRIENERRKCVFTPEQLEDFAS